MQDNAKQILDKIDPINKQMEGISMQAILEQEWVLALTQCKVVLLECSSALKVFHDNCCVV